MTFGELALCLLMTALTCRTCQFPVYLQSSSTAATRRRDWRARSRSPRAAVTPLRVVVDAGTLSWNELEHQAGSDNLTSPVYVDHCLRELTPQVTGLYVVPSQNAPPLPKRPPFYQVEMALAHCKF